ncbi:hypothetical protein, partial [Pseudomonas fluorescens]|uniref:hypothetical protein n=1 Tax=Pseudomonas fluorescens TaxID=294 RepID=UPI0037F83B38
MRKNFRHLKPSLKRSLQQRKNNFYMTKTRVFYSFYRKEVEKKPRTSRNAVHLSGAALRSTGNRVFEIFTVLGLEGLGR